MEYAKLINAFIDPRTDMLDLIESITTHPETGEKMEKSEFVAKSLLTLVAAYVRLLHCHKREEYEEAKAMTLFIKSFLNVYRYAVQGYQDFTLKDFYRLDQANDRLRAEYFPHSVMAVA